MEVTFGKPEQCANCKRLYPPATDLVAVVAYLGEPFNHKFFANICRECAETMYTDPNYSVGYSNTEDEG